MRALLAQSEENLKSLEAVSVPEAPQAISEQHFHCGEAESCSGVVMDVLFVTRECQDYSLQLTLGQCYASLTYHFGIFNKCQEKTSNLLTITLFVAFRDIF